MIFESIVMKWVDRILEKKIDDKQFGGGVGTSTTDALVQMIHHWCEATDRCGTYVRIEGFRCKTHYIHFISFEINVVL